MSSLSGFHHRFEVRWAELDANGHMRHSAYLDFPAQIRIAFFNEHGFNVRRLQEMRIGPVLFNEYVEYRREIRDSEFIDVDLALMGLSKNKKHWRIRHQIFKEDGVLASVLDCRGAWLHMDERRVVAAPDALYEAIEKMPRTEDFTWIDS